MIDSPDHYRVLGVRSDASAAAIRTAYVKLMKRFHPDRADGDPKAERYARLVTGAYRCLTDPEQRLAYDRRRSANRRARAVRPKRPSSKPYYPAADRRRAPAALFAVSLLVVTIGVGWAAQNIQPSPPAVRDTRTAAAAAVPIADPPREALIEDAVVDLVSIRDQFGAAGARDYVGRCFGELGGSSSTTFLDYCLALDAAAALSASHAEAAGYFAPAARAARLAGVTTVSVTHLAQRRSAIERAVASRIAVLRTPEPFTPRARVPSGDAAAR